MIRTPSLLLRPDTNFATRPEANIPRRYRATPFEGGLTAAP